jgi:hypothetical protein
MDVLKIIPPFTYSYQCGSTLLVAYIPVYLYTTSLQIFADLGRIGILFVTVPENYPQWLWKFLPGIAWPMWHHSLTRNLECDSGNCNVLHHDAPLTTLVGNATTMPSVNSFPTVTLFRSARVISRVMNNTLLLLSFGITSPVLGCFLLLNIILSLSSWMLLVGRYVIMTMTMQDPGSSHDLSSRHTIGEREDKARVEMALGPKTRSTERYSQSVPPQRASGIIELSSCLEGVSGYIQVCKWPILCTSCFFISLVCWDIVGDQIGWKDSLWVPGSSVFVLMIYWAYGRYAQSSFKRAHAQPESSSLVTDLSSQKI